MLLVFEGGGRGVRRAALARRGGGRAMGAGGPALRWRLLASGLAKYAKHTVLYYVILCYVMLCCDILYYTILHYTMIYYRII